VTFKTNFCVKSKSSSHVFNVPMILSRIVCQADAYKLRLRVTSVLRTPAWLTTGVEPYGREDMHLLLDIHPGILISLP